MSESTVDVKKIINAKLHNKNIIEPLVNKTFEEFRFKNNNFLEKDKFITIINGIYRTLRLPPPLSSTIDSEFQRFNKKKDGKLKKEEYREIIEDLIKVVLDNL